MFDCYPWLITFGSYWIFDTPGAIQTQLTAWFGGAKLYTPLMNLTLYSVYSYPNIVLAFFGGFIIDKVTGVRFGTLLFVAMVFIGQVIFSLGIQFGLYPLCVVGRVIFGLGGESLTVGQNAYVVRWFDGQTMAFAFGLVVAFSRIGSSVNFLITPLFAEIGVPFSVWFGTSMCLISFIAAIYVAFLDWYGEARVEARKKAKDGIQDSDEPEEEVKLTHVLRFPLQAWLVFLICSFFYISVLTFYSVASQILQETGKHYSPVEASRFIFFPNFVAIFAAPIFGKVVDKVGRTLWFIVIGCAMQIVAHVVFLCMAMDVFFIHPIILMVWVGLGYSIIAATVWSVLPFIIPEKLLGTGFGMMTSIQNLGMAVAPQIVGLLQTKFLGTSWEYNLPIMIFIGCAGIAMGITIFLIVVDLRRNNGVLNAPDRKQEWKERLNGRGNSAVNTVSISDLPPESAPLLK